MLESRPTKKWACLALVVVQSSLIFWYNLVSFTFWVEYVLGSLTHVIK